MKRSKRKKLRKERALGQPYVWKRWSLLSRTAHSSSALLRVCQARTCALQDSGKVHSLEKRFGVFFVGGLLLFFIFFLLVHVCSSWRLQSSWEGLHVQITACSFLIPFPLPCPTCFAIFFCTLVDVICLPSWHAYSAYNHWVIRFLCAYLFLIFPLLLFFLLLLPSHPCSLRPFPIIRHSFPCPFLAILYNFVCTLPHSDERYSI